MCSSTQQKPMTLKGTVPFKNNIVKSLRIQELALIVPMELFIHAALQVFHKSQLEFALSTQCLNTFLCTNNSYVLMMCTAFHFRYGKFT